MRRNALLGSVLLLPLALGACFERAQPSVENVVRPVQVIRVALTDDAGTRSFAGTVRPRREADVAFRAGGRMVTRLVDTGARVTTGQILARLDPADLALSVRGAEADLASAQAQLAQASADARRSRALLKDGWVAQSNDDVRQANARAAEERVASARAALQLARNKLSYADLRAPADGVVTAVLADPGTVVSEGTPVLRVAEAGPPEVEVSLPEQALPDAARPGAVVTLWARPDEKLQAKLRELSPTASGALRTYTARYAVENPPDWLALGMSAALQLPSATGTKVAILPASAIGDRGNGAMVWVTREGEAAPLEQRAVQVQRMQQDRVLVTGVRSGELVVAMGVQKLDPATRVRVIDARPISE